MCDTNQKYEISNIPFARAYLNKEDIHTDGEIKKKLE